MICLKKTNASQFWIYTDYELYLSKPFLKILLCVVLGKIDAVPFIETTQSRRLYSVHMHLTIVYCKMRTIDIQRSIRLKFYARCGQKYARKELIHSNWSNCVIFFLQETAPCLSSIISSLKYFIDTHKFGANFSNDYR